MNFSFLIHSVAIEIKEKTFFFAALHFEDVRRKKSFLEDLIAKSKCIPTATTFHFGLTRLNSQCEQFPAKFSEKNWILQNMTPMEKKICQKA